MVREYIGARYVPKFMGAYDQTTEYEALCVVDNGQGTSYITKVPTPAGTPLTNTNYWAIYGATSGAVINLQNQIGDLNDLKTADKDNLVDAINEIKGKKYVFVMDSYGTFHTDEDNYNYVQLACAMCGLVENTDYFQFYQSGAGFCAEAPHQFLEILQNNEHVITDKSSITDVVVFGSANDQLGTYNTIRSGIASFWNYIKNNYPNAKIHIGCISKSIENATYMSVLPTVYNAYRDAIDFGIDYIDNTEYIMSWLNLYRTDALHPTEAAIDVLARYVAQWIKFGHLSVHRKFSSNNILDFTNSPLLDLRAGATQPQILMSQDNGSITAQCASSGILASCVTKMARTLQSGTTVITSAVELVDSLFYPNSNNSSSWYGALWHGNDRYGAILTFMSDGIAANNKKVQCQLILENTTGAAVTINAGENVSLIFAQPVTYVL